MRRRHAPIALVAALFLLSLPALEAAACDDPSASATEYGNEALQGCDTEKSAEQYCKKWRASCKKKVKSEAQCLVKERKLRVAEELASCKVSVFVLDEKACRDAAKSKTEPLLDDIKQSRNEGLQKCEDFNCVSHCFI
jgi:hypothetical protein